MIIDVGDYYIDTRLISMITKPINMGSHSVYKVYMYGFDFCISVNQFHLKIDDLLCYWEVTQENIGSISRS
jgi:hypothetical protein